jgi:peptide-methionine (R)-S-oxide reductase
VAYEILRNKATERAFTGAHWSTRRPGTYFCAGCDARLFRSTEKFDSGCGWPAFSEAISADAVATEVDALVAP